MNTVYGTHFQFCKYIFPTQFHVNTIVRMEDSALDKIFALVHMVSADLSVRTEHVQSIVKMEVFAQCQEISANVEKVSTDQDVTKGKHTVSEVVMLKHALIVIRKYTTTILILQIQN